MSKQPPVEEVSQVKRKMTIDVSSEHVASALTDAYKEIQKKAKMQGFREGKVPLKILEKHYREDAEARAMEALVQASYPDAVQAAGVTPVSRPSIDPGVLKKGEGFSYVATFEVHPTVVITDYAKLSLSCDEFSVEEHEIDDQLSAMQQSMTKLAAPEEGAVLESGVVAKIDYTGTSDGKDFEGNSATDFTLDVGAGTLLPEFEQQILGMKAGDSRSIHMTYPSDYFNISLAGSEASFDVTVKEIRKKLIPDLNDDFAKELGAYQTLTEVRKAIHEQIAQYREGEVRSQLGKQALDAILEKNAFDIPEALVGYELQWMFQQMEQQAKSEGKTMDDLGYTPQAFTKEHEETARYHIRCRLALDAIALEEQIDIGEENVEQRLQEIAESANETVPKVRLYYEQNNLLQGLKEDLKREKCLDFVLEKAKIKRKKQKKSKNK